MVKVIQRLTPFKLFKQSLNLTSHTQKDSARDKAPPHRPPHTHTQTTQHLIELIDDSLGYVTRTGNRRNKRRRPESSEESASFGRTEGQRLMRRACLSTYVDKKNAGSVVLKAPFFKRMKAIKKVSE